jgi:Outer membrane lipoprotein carrier protein LolA-like
MIRRLGLALLLLCLPVGSLRATEMKPDTLRAGEVLRGHFVQERQLAGFSRPLKSAGSFVLAPGQGLIWRTEMPLADTIVITPGGILQIVNGKEAMRLPVARLPVVGRFYDVLGGALTGNTGPLDSVFTVERQADAGAWHLILRPARADDPALGQIVSITVGGTRLVDAIEIQKQGGDTDRLSFSAQAKTAGGLTADEADLFKRSAE